MRRLVKRILRRAGYRLERTRPSRSDDPVPPKPKSPLNDLDDVVYRVGDWRFEIPLDDAAGRPCFGYGPSLWHPYVAAVEEIIAQPSLRFGDSVLRRHFEKWQPKSISDAYFPFEKSPHPILERIPAESLFDPWVKRPPPCQDPLEAGCRPAGSPLFGPIRPQEAEDEFIRLRSMLRSIEEFGYRPDDFPRGLIKVVVLRHHDQQRYLIAHGQHRAAVLAALGHEHIVVGIHRELPPLIDSDRVHEWPYVANGLLDKDTAVRMLERYFQESDSHPSRVVAKQVVTQ